MDGAEELTHVLNGWQVKGPEGFFTPVVSSRCSLTASSLGETNGSHLSLSLTRRKV